MRTIACFGFGGLMALATGMGVSHDESFRQEPDRMRARQLGIRIGTIPTGPLNAITDVAGVAVGHATLNRGDAIRTGVTLVIPDTRRSAFLFKLPAAVYTGNGFGKAAGFTQVEELGNIEAPIALTNTLSVGAVLDAMVKESVSQPGHEELRSINVVVGETNDGWLNDIRGLHVGHAEVAQAWKEASTGPVAEGCVGAGMGTLCFGYKGGIGTASRLLKPGSEETYVVGVLVQSNFGGRLRIDGRRYEKAPDPKPSEDGSCMIVIATDAPLDARNLERLARRALLGLARCGSVMSNGSGDYVIAFSTHAGNRIPHRGPMTREMTVLANRAMTPLFHAVVDATEEAVLNSLFMAHGVTGRNGHRGEAIDLDRVRALIDSR